MNNGLPLADEWVYAELAGDAELAAVVGDRIYRRFAPEGAQFPFVIFAAQTGAVQLTADGRKVFDAPVYQVKVVAVAPIDDDGVTAANRIEALFGDRENVIFGDYRFGSIVEQYVNFNEFDKIYYEHLGGLYRLRIWEG